MWTNENRSFDDRSKLRYPSDLTDEEWALIEPEIRPPAKRGGGKRTVDMREVVNGLMYALSPGAIYPGPFLIKTSRRAPRCMAISTFGMLLSKPPLLLPTQLIRAVVPRSLRCGQFQQVEWQRQRRTGLCEGRLALAHSNKSS